MEKQEIKITIERWNFAVSMCWLAVITGVAGLILRVVAGSPDFLWVSIVGLVAGGLGVTLGGPLKTIETRKVMLSPFVNDD
jgi:hypothetical protein